MFDSIQSNVPKVEKAKYQPIPFADPINVSLVFDSPADMVHMPLYLSRIPHLPTSLLSFSGCLLVNIESFNCVLTVTADPRQIH